jgi:hypothetical protein
VRPAPRRLIGYRAAAPGLKLKGTAADLHELASGLLLLLLFALVCVLQEADETALITGIVISARRRRVTGG